MPDSSPNIPEPPSSGLSEAPETTGTGGLSEAPPAPGGTSAGLSDATRTPAPAPGTPTPEAPQRHQPQTAPAPPAPTGTSGGGRGGCMTAMIGLFVLIAAVFGLLSQL